MNLFYNFSIQEKPFVIFIVQERAEFCKTCYLIGSSSGRNFSILPANPGGFVARPGPCFLEKIIFFTSLGRFVLGKTLSSVLSAASGTVLANTDLPAGE